MSLTQIRTRTQNTNPTPPSNHRRPPIPPATGQLKSAIPPKPAKRTFSRPGSQNPMTPPHCQPRNPTPTIIGNPTPRPANPPPAGPTAENDTK